MGKFGPSDYRVCEELITHNVFLTATRFIAQEFLAPNALAFVQTTLGEMYDFSLGPAATVGQAKVYSIN